MNTVIFEIASYPPLGEVPVLLVWFSRCWKKILWKSNVLASTPVNLHVIFCVSTRANQQFRLFPRKEKNAQIKCTEGSLGKRLSCFAIEKSLELRKTGTRDEEPMYWTFQGWGKAHETSKIEYSFTKRPRLMKRFAWTFAVKFFGKSSKVIAVFWKTVLICSSEIRIGNIVKRVFWGPIFSWVFCVVLSSRNGVTSLKLQTMQKCYHCAQC